MKVNSWEEALDQLADERRLLLDILGNITELWDIESLTARTKRIDDAVKAAKITLVNMNKKDA